MQKTIVAGGMLSTIFHGASAAFVPPSSTHYTSPVHTCPSPIDGVGSFGRRSRGRRGDSVDIRGSTHRSASVIRGSSVKENEKNKNSAMFPPARIRISQWTRRNNHAKTRLISGMTILQMSSSSSPQNNTDDEHNDDIDFSEFEFLDDEFMIEAGDLLLDDDGDDDYIDYEDYDDADLLELLDLPDDNIIGPSATNGKGDVGKAELDEMDSRGQSLLERALLEGVVPAEAGVGSGCLPGDYGFDPLNLASKDYIFKTQQYLLNILPSPGEDTNNDDDLEEKEARSAFAALPAETPDRPPALVLRDYREAEIRHGRLAMLAAVFWPLQEIIDRLVFYMQYGMPQSEYEFTVIYGGLTLPYISLFMTFVMLCLGYLDIYAKAIKEIDTGEAFLPGECFWDPLNMLAGAPDRMKKRTQEIELNNGRWAMVAVASYILQEGLTHTPVVNLPWNQILFEPAFQIPAVQHWLDARFESQIPPYLEVENFVEAVNEALSQQEPPLPMEDFS